MPFLGLSNFVDRLKFKARRARFSTSADYWEDRYRRGGKSGAGSYHRLATFKAKVLNDFVAANGINSVIEFGSGDGAQLELAAYPAYTGVDVSETILNATRKKFAGDKTIRFLHPNEVLPTDQADLALSLDVIYHLVEDDVFDTYMRQLCDAARRFVIVYSSNEDKEWPDPHVRHRNFSRWIEINRTNMQFVQKISNAYPYSKDDPDNTSFADFYVFEKADR